jgi:hypothetical protein
LLLTEIYREHKVSRVDMQWFINQSRYSADSSETVDNNGHAVENNNDSFISDEEEELVGKLNHCITFQIDVT